MNLISEEGLAHLKSVEGLRLESYQDTVGVWTIGYGHTGKLGDHDLGPGMVIDKAYALELLQRRLKDEFEPAVNKAIKVPISQLQYDALVSFCYNVGVGAFAKSTLVKKINLRDFAGSAEEFDRWHKPIEITSRRNKEKAMFIRGTV